jgi:uncharacterized membrane protein (UPF0127 family)
MSAERLRLRRIGDDAIVCHRLVLGTSFMQRFRGLMGRASLPEGEGLYLPDTSIHMMFMRFPIDALFVAEAGADGRRAVVGLRKHLPPWRGLVMPVRGAQGVIEMPAGTLARHDLAEGDEVVFEPLPPTAGEASSKAA